MTSVTDEGTEISENFQQPGVHMKEGRVRADSKGRVSLGGFLMKGISDLYVATDAEGRITLTPLTLIPARELWIHRNPEKLAALDEGLQQAAEGKYSKLDLSSLDLSDDE